MRNKFYFIGLSIVCCLGISLVLGGCATKKFVQEGFDRQDGKISELETSIEENQQRIKEHQNKISTLSDDTQKAFAEAENAMSEAERAQTMARGKLLYSIVLTNENVQFGFDSTDITESAKTILAEFASVVKTENRNIFIEIHGHTDSSGPEKYNMELGLKRAEMVKKYLFEQGIALHRLSTISYGEAEPIGPNDSRNNRANNRRVVIIVLQ